MSDVVEDGLKFVVGVGLMIYAPYLSPGWAAVANLAGSVLITDSLAEEELPKPEEGLEGALANQNSNKAYIPLIYGTRRIGGTRVFLGTHGSKNKFLDMVLVLAEGPIKGFRAAYADDALLHFHDYTNYVGKWKNGRLLFRKDSDGNSYTEYTFSYSIGDVVFHNGEYWTATAFSFDEEPDYGSGFWSPNNSANTIEGIDKDGTPVGITYNEYGTLYLNVANTTGFTAGNFVRGQTSGATAKIVSVDGINHYIYIERIQNNTTTDKGFSISETIEETDKRNGTITGTSSAGIAPMLNKEAIYFKDRNAVGGVGYTVTGETLPTTSTKLNKETKDFKDLIRFSFHNGATDQIADPDLVSAHPDWTNNHRLRGKAYVYIRLKYDKEKLTGIPNFTFLVDGREVYDPRSTQTEFSNNPALCIRDYLTNTVYGRGLDSTSIDDTAIIAEANYSDEIIDITDTEYEGTKVGTTRYYGPRYGCDMRVDTGRKVFENIKTLLATMRSSIVFTNGFYRLLADKENVSYHTFDEKNIINGIQLSLGNKRNTFNEVKITFPNPDKNWESDESIYYNDTIRTTLDNNLPLVKNLTLTGVANTHRALYIGLQELKQSRQQIIISFKTGIEGLLVETGDVLRMRSLKYGWGTVTRSVDGQTVNVYNVRTGADIDPHELYSNGVVNGDDGVAWGDALGTGPMYKEFKVLSVVLDSNLEVSISALEYDPTVYTTFPATVEDATPNTNMSDATIAQPPTNLAASEFLYVSKDTSGFKAGLNITWDESDSPWDQSYQISIAEPIPFWKPNDAYPLNSIVNTNGGTYYQNTGGAIAINQESTFNTTGYWTDISATYTQLDNLKVVGVTEDRNFTIRDVKDGWHIIQVRSINSQGVLSDPETITYEVQILSAPPLDVTGLGLIVNNDTAVLTWNKSTELDVLISGSVQIRHSAITDLELYTTDAMLNLLWDTANPLAEGKSGATSQVFLPLLVGTYLIKFIDASGNPSNVPAAIVNTVSPTFSSTFLYDWSERDDYNADADIPEGFDGIDEPYDTGGTTTGLERITYDGQTVLQFTTTNGTTFADPPLVKTGTYYLYNAYEFEGLIDAELSVDVDILTYDINNLVSDWTDIDSLTSIDDTSFAASVTTKISITQDDPSDSGAVWSEYFTFLSGTVKCRGARALVEVSVSQSDVQIEITDIKFIFKGRNRIQSKSDLLWSTADYNTGYKDIWYDTPFFQGDVALGLGSIEPNLNISINTTNSNVGYLITNGTQEYINGPGTGGPTSFSGFRITFYEESALGTLTDNLINVETSFGYQSIGY